MKWLIRLLLAALLLFFSWLAWVVWVPVDLPSASYSLTVGPNRTLSQVVRGLKQAGLIKNRTVMIVLARLDGTERNIKTGLYRFDAPVSMWAILARLRAGQPDEASVTVIEGWNFHQFRALLDRSPDLQHQTRDWSDSQILTALSADLPNPEGLFFPSTYYFTPGSSDLEVFRRAYQTMQQQLDVAWQGRSLILPLTSPYQLLILASLVEKETARDQDREMVSAVFVNRLKQPMRLQTDPSVIYGMGDAYKGHISKADLKRDTPYNTYTRDGLTPTPIALPGTASLQAAAHPAASRALYFVARGDGSSYFSETLAEHNGAVRKYILKKGN
jgi:UPF0755 protein